MRRGRREGEEGEIAALQYLIYRRSRQQGRRQDARERVDGRLARVARVDRAKRLLIYRRDRGLRCIIINDPHHTTVRTSSFFIIKKVRTDGVGEDRGDPAWGWRGGGSGAPGIEAVVRRCGERVLVDEVAAEARGDAIRLRWPRGVEHYCR